MKAAASGAARKPSAVAQEDTRISFWVGPDGTGYVTGEDGGFDGQTDRLEVYRGDVQVGEPMQMFDYGAGVKVTPGSTRWKV